MLKLLKILVPFFYKKKTMLTDSEITTFVNATNRFKKLLESNIIPLNSDRKYKDVFRIYETLNETLVSSLNQTSRLKDAINEIEKDTNTVKKFNKK